MSHSAVVDEWRGRERALADLGVEVTLVTARTWPEGGAPVALRPRPGERVEGVGTLGRHPALFLYDPRPIWRRMGEAWDVIDVHEEPFSLATAELLLIRALRRNRAPVVLYTAQNLAKRYPVPFRWLERLALRTASGISACNADAARIVETKGFAGRARVIPLGVDLGRYHADPQPDAGPGPDADPARSADRRVVVGFAGRLVPEKGVGVLLEALSHDDRLSARVAGDGPAAAGLRTAAARGGLGDRIEFVGPLAPEELPAFYRSVDVIAVPSIPTRSWTEQFGRVAIEAMASGIPVVASDAGALPDVVGGAGIVVPVGDPQALASALVEAGGPRARELRDLGLARAASCSWAAIGEAYRDLYRSVQRNAPRIGDPDQGERPRALEVVLVAYGSPDLLVDALRPLVGLPVTVVDNSSMPEIAALCAELGVRYLDPRRNGGFAAGVNFALARRLRPGADVLLVNPDAVVTPAAIETLHAALLARADLASVGPSQVDGNGTRTSVEWRFPSPAAAWLEAIGLGRLRRGPTFVIGSVLLLRAEALDQVGWLDEGFFLYAEETDWAYRAHRLGWRHAEVVDAHAMHVGAGTSSDPDRREAHFHASLERYLRKHHGELGWQAARVAQWLGAMARSVALPGERGRAARKRAALYRLGPVRVEARYLRRTTGRAA
ncbi:glycosyltransferase [Agromyces sp. C10]|uniref:glycosyltransferase n=1 Tax=Agromyces sp. C10 TaxID=2935077 RepID=UPI00200ABD1B|nr:glycosyltransferase [Agromyces sp. C10]MCK8610148.1 glycosyltransferase [Agromyces sp. C10]